MGSCVSSSQSKSSSASDSVVKLAAFISKPDTTSPLKTDVMITSSTVNGIPPIDSGRRDSGSKEEMIFFDSRGWLDSDCDDDFMSVDGEFTPSRGTTPVHHKFCDQTPQGEEKTHEEEEPSPTDNKKRLLELFKETQDEDEEEEDCVAEGKARACLWIRTPARSSAPATPYNNNKERQQKFKSVRSSAHGRCVPRLVSCSSFTDRRRNMMSTHAPIDVQR
ncbi:hypothetical protein ISN45_Aa03g000210 [Arabidopsis thaliana x Arabidopsis arenosa]|uniref:Uncharacterized protein n=1 Tax=Arabidopsis thaliana x Arabidopsis arenosa TaxID=1240361 RepID=A0A8T2ATZ7_9BRAS|nr:hypothetical protein ISN45_Aa03g000210 [Arabidopsis thaliana x Arabidopsis arenosa]